MKLKEVKIGNLLLSNKSQVIVQTSDILATIKQIKLLEKHGLQLIRVSVLDEFDAKAIKDISKKVNIPIIADIHFNYKLAILAIESGASKIRINPGNIKDIVHLKKIVDKANEYNVAIRIGINSGSLKFDNKLNIAKQMVCSAIKYIKLFESWKFYNIIVSLKNSNHAITKEAYVLANKKIRYPLHAGVTEAGGLIEATIKSTICLSELLLKNMCQTIRISINGDPLKEIEVANKLLFQLGLKKYYDIIACPLCGRNKYKTFKWYNEINKFLFQNQINIKVAIMGCIVNGPGEASESDLGVFVKDENYSIIFYKGNQLKQVKNIDIVEELKKLIVKFSKGK